MSTYLVTGATGFLGSHLVDALLAEKHKVVALSRRPLPTLEKRGVKVVIGNILDGASVEKAAAGCDGLFHCAGVVSRDAEDNRLMMEVNYGGTIITLDAAKAAGVPRCVYVSTSGTVAISEEEGVIANEDSETPYTIIGKWGYYRSKLYAEEEALKRNSKDFEVVCINPTILLGPGDTKGSSTNDVRMFLEGKVPANPTGGLSFVDVRDVAACLVTAMDFGDGGQRYLLGACNITFADFFGRLSRLSGVSAPTLPIPKNPFLASLGNSLFNKFQDLLGGEEGPDEVSLEMSSYYWYLDPSFAIKELEFQTRDPMTTLNDTIQDLRKRGVVWPTDSSNELLNDKLLQGAAVLGGELQNKYNNARDAFIDSLFKRNGR